MLVMHFYVKHVHVHREATNEANLHIQRNTKALINKMRTSCVRYLAPPLADFIVCANRCACTCARIAQLP
jgi:hypothetical protein